MVRKLINLSEAKWSEDNWSEVLLNYHNNCLTVRKKTIFVRISGQKKTNLSEINLDGQKL